MKWRFVLSCFLFFLASAIFLRVGECREFIFVVNTSQSMNASDPLHVVQDGLTWSMENFSAEDEVAVIAFKDTPIVVRPLSKIGDAPIKIEFDYSGESNAGEALLTAINMFKLDYGIERNIIVISNGEIALSDPAATLKSWEDFNACLQQAKWLDIAVYVVKLRYFGAPQNYHSFAHDAKEIPGDYLDLMTTLRTLMFDTFRAPHLELSPKNLTQGKFFCEVPIFPTDRLKFSLLSSNQGVAELKSDSDVIAGNFVKIFKLNAPTANEFEFDINYPQGTGLTLDVVAEVEGTLQTNLQTSIFAKNILEITPVHGGTEQKKILADNFFDGKSLRVQVDGKIISSTVRDGVIRVELADVGNKISLEKIFFEDLGIIFVGENSAQIDVAAGRNYLPWILAVAGVAVILVLSYLLSRKRTLRRKLPATKNFAPKIIPPELSADKPIRDKNFFYRGELIVSVLKNPNKDYIEPRTFNLFRLNSAAPVDLTAVLQACGIDFDAKDFHGIIFSPSANGVYVENNSDCTLVKLNKPIAKGSYAELYHEDSIDAATPDRSAELIVTYRNSKPT